MSKKFNAIFFSSLLVFSFLAIFQLNAVAIGAAETVHFKVRVDASPKLKGKLHIYVGTADTFHLDEAIRLLDAELKKLGSDAKFEYLEGRSHFDMYQDGLGDKIANEMYQVARPKAKSAKN